MLHGKGHVSCVDFSPDGAYLAGGTADGRLCLWDLKIRALTVSWQALCHPVAKIKWSEDGGRIAACGGRLYIRDVRDPGSAPCVISGLDIVDVHFHPKDKDCVLVDLRCAPSLAIFVSNHTPGWKTIHTTEILQGKGSQVSCFSSNGQHVFVSDSLCNLYCVDFCSNEARDVVLTNKSSFLVHRVISLSDSSVPLPQAMLSLPNGNGVALNVDRSIRIYRCAADGELQCSTKIVDSIGKSAWAAFSVSPDGEIIAAVPCGSGIEQEILLFENGRVIKRLEGPKDGICSLAWHPKKSLLASLSISGYVMLWTAAKPPFSHYGDLGAVSTIDGFQIIEENVEYTEREDEFDFDSTPFITCKKAKSGPLDLGQSGIEPCPISFSSLSILFRSAIQPQMLDISPATS